MTTVATKYGELYKCIQILYQSSEKCRVKHMVELAMQRSAVLLDRTESDSMKVPWVYDKITKLEAQIAVFSKWNMLRGW